MKGARGRCGSAFGACGQSRRILDLERGKEGGERRERREREREVLDGSSRDGVTLKDELDGVPCRRGSGRCTGPLAHLEGDVHGLVRVAAPEETADVGVPIFEGERAETETQQPTRMENHREHRVRGEEWVSVGVKGGDRGRETGRTRLTTRRFSASGRDERP